MKEGNRFLMEDLDSIYTDIIMEHSIATYNKRSLTDPTEKEHGHNPSCGDDITLEVKMNGDVIEDLSFTGHGCAISQASTSIMIDLLKGRKKQEAIELIEIFLKMIKREDVTEEEQQRLEDAIALKNISNMPARVKCAELAWYTMQTLMEKI